MGKIILNGKHYEIGVPVKHWYDSTGFDAYDTNKVVIEEEDRKTGKNIKKVIKGKRYSKRAMTTEKSLSLIHQIVIHHTGGYKPTPCFQTLHNQRKLSVQFILDDFGNVYQTLDAIEMAWHAGSQNKKSIGIECCLKPDAKSNPDAYSEDRCSRLKISPHTETIEQRIQGHDYKVFAMPNQQVQSLARLVATLWYARADQLVLPRESPIFPTDSTGEIPMDFDESYKNHEGLVLHAHVSPKKWDAAGLHLREFELLVKNYFEIFRKNGAL